MFARGVTIKLKPNSVPEFTRTLEKDVIPLLKKQRGFMDEITFVGTDNHEAVAISLWDRRENAEAYHRGPYSEVMRLLGTVVEGTPHVRDGEVTTSTVHKIGAAAAAQ